MVKIPELPGSYRPGDVVNGHVLSPRGHWVSLADAASRGIRVRRYLDTQVSTIRDSEAPTPVLRERPRAQGPTATYQLPPVPPQPPISGTTTAPPRVSQPRPATPPPPGPARTPTPARTPAHGPAPLPRVQATPSTFAAPPPPATPPPARTGPGGATSPSGTANPYAARPSPPRPAPPRSSNNQSAGRKIIGIIVVAFILFQVLSGILRSIDFASFGSSPTEGETSTEYVAAEEPAWSDEDVDVSNLEWWSDDTTAQFLADTITTTDGESSLSIRVYVEAFDAEENYLGDGTSWVTLRPGELTRSTGFLEVDDPEAIAELVPSITVLSQREEVSALEVVSWDVGDTSMWLTADAEILVGAEDDATDVQAVAVVRDESGAILAGATEYEPELPAGETSTVSINLWALPELPEGATVEVTAAAE
ncbi:MAG: hypothetical protein GX593_08850 [Actinomycetales bacterium]|nr:hypothetical protein [Actinomycetales bacterium]